MPIKFTTKGFIELWRGNTKVSQHTIESEAVERATADAEKTKAVLYTLKYPNKEIDLSTLSRVVFDPDTLAPTAPVISASAASQTSISVALVSASTDIQSGIASYRIEYKRTVDSTWSVGTAAIGAASFPFTLSGLTANTSYDVRCRATDGASNVGPFSAVSSALTPTSVVPPVWSTVPTITFTQGVAANIDVSVYDSKGSTDTITHTAGTFPSGVSFNVSHRRYEYDGIGAVGGTNGHILTADDGAGDWALRSTGPGVILAAPLSTATELNAWRFAGAEAVPPSVDTSLRCIGQAASIRFTSSPTDGSESGTLRIPFGRTFIEGETFYVHFRQHMPPGWAYMTHPVSSTGQEQGMKQIILSGTSSSNQAFEVVLENSTGRNLVNGYNNSSGGFKDWYGTAGGDIIFQPLIDNSGAGTTISPDSVYSSVNGGTDPDTGSAFSAAQIAYARYGGSYDSRLDAAFAFGLGHPLSGQMRYPVDQFATYLVAVTVGTWSVANTRVRVWCAPSGQPYKKLYDKSDVIVSDDQDHGYNAAWLLAYYTARVANSGKSVIGRSNTSLVPCTAIRTIGNGTTAGAGTLTYTAATKTFRWQEFGGSQGTARGVAAWKRFINVHSSGSVQQSYDNSKHLGIEITNFAALPTTDQTDTITIQNGRGTQITNYTEFIVSTQPINATAYDDNGVKIGPTGGYAPT